MGAAEDWEITRRLRRQRERPPVQVKAEYRVKCRHCGRMTDWLGDDICPECAKKLPAPVNGRHGQRVYGN